MLSRNRLSGRKRVYSKLRGLKIQEVAGLDRHSYARKALNDLSWKYWNRSIYEKSALMMVLASRKFRSNRLLNGSSSQGMVSLFVRVTSADRILVKSLNSIPVRSV